MMLAVGLKKIDTIYGLRKFPSIPDFLRIFTRNGCYILSNAFFVPTEMTIWFFFFGFLIW